MLFAPLPGLRAVGLLLAVVSTASAAPAPAERPHILWITIEDWSPDLSCYGTPGIETPHVDALAAEGVRYTRAFTTAPVCSPSRSALMTGVHQNWIGAEQHRTQDKRPLPHGVRQIPHLLADAGYFTCLMSSKVDVNFLPDAREELFQGTDWTQRAEGQPFFARISFQGTHRPWNRDPQRPIDPADVELPPYYADTPFIRRDWANGLEQMQLVDREVGALLKRLEDEGLAENTLVFFTADHGRCHIRGKQFLYDPGLHVPLIVRWPGRIEPGGVNDDLVTAIDLCATALDAAGVTPPVPLHGASLLGPEIAARKYVFAARDRMGATHDAMRTIRSKEYKLILNLMPERPWCQFSSYKEGAYPALAEMSVLYLKGELTPEQAAFFAPSKPEVELFDLRSDPHEVNNVADDPALSATKAELLAELQRWRTEVIADRGVSEAFRARGVFPPERPTPTVGEWVFKHAAEYDMRTHGEPPWYPTRTLAEWEAVRALWEPYVFRGPEERVRRPRIPHTRKPPSLR
ncbi:sulfatase family protein [Alienimonas californiensis]|uniref:Arylsulfatase n=1 Tax=Alienimonas californiensis TaxID=2527989 RepID=A0A517P418_9PLAN|nr:sulfatase [Alienimonas californiensis]QDT14106.1 Arylsulfatase [Alienimonas californiensis]